MRLVNLTTPNLTKLIGIFCLLILTFNISKAQDNSPHSRYGIGDIVPNTNIISRGMGGVATAYSDYQSLNISNPSALGYVTNTIFDFGVEYDALKLRSNTNAEKYSSKNLNISYFQLGFPIASWNSKKLKTNKDIFWGASFGMRPVTRVSYKTNNIYQFSGSDSINSIYEGDGGLTQANFSTGIKIKSLNIGASFGYAFGKKNYGSKINFLNTGAQYYYKSNSETQSNFGGVFLNLGAQYQYKLDSSGSKFLRFGILSNLKQTLKGKKDLLNETFEYNADGEPINHDTINYVKGTSGKVVIPALYSFGVTYNDPHWVIGADYDYSNQDSYKFFGSKDSAVTNRSMFRLGLQYFPATISTLSTKYLSFVRYRVGFYYGTDYIKLEETRPDIGVSFGAGFPLTSLTRYSYGDFVTLNTAIELGLRGNKNTGAIRENITRFSIGISMNAKWFQKYKYQ